MTNGLKQLQLHLKSLSPPRILCVCVVPGRDGLVLLVPENRLTPIFSPLWNLACLEARDSGILMEVGNSFKSPCEGNGLVMSKGLHFL